MLQKMVFLQFTIRHNNIMHNISSYILCKMHKQSFTLFSLLPTNVFRPLHQNGIQKVELYC